jgi:hypothetical protein
MKAPALPADPPARVNRDLELAKNDRVVPRAAAEPVSELIGCPDRRAR